MKRILLSTILMAALALGPAGMRAAETDAEVDAHRAALDLAGAFTNDGFKLRDGDYAGTLKAGEATVIQVNLYAGNQYWFTVATADPGTMVTIDVYGEDGKLVKSDPYTNANRAAAGFAPDLSGPYYVRIAATAGAAVTYCLIYSYK